jgi:N-acetylmuramoyl-L-alanine amidase
MVESRDAAKLRLLREAVLHNVGGYRTARPGRPAARRPRFAVPLSLLASALVAGLALLSLGPEAVSRGWPRPGAPAHVRLAAAEARLVSADARPTAPEARLAIDETARMPDDLAVAPRRLARAVLPLSVKRIVIDPGHGGAQLGALSASGVAEKEITLDLALRLRRLLQGGPFEVLMTRDTDATVSLEDRVAFANARRADLFVSIHINWIPRREVRPLETYYVGPTDDPHALELAGIENRDSGYSLSEYRRLLEKIYIDARRDESQALARNVNAELFRSLRDVNPALENRGVKTAPFAVLVGTEMPAILVEVSCLSNEQDVALLTKADYRDRIAAALLKGIRGYAAALDGGGKEG